MSLEHVERERSFYSPQEKQQYNGATVDTSVYCKSMINFPVHKTYFWAVINYVTYLITHSLVGNITKGLNGEKRTLSDSHSECF